jgi:hypothetical protein
MLNRILYVVAALVVMGMAFWAYQENYETKNALSEVARLNAEIGKMREALTMHRAEWAYLNRPERLRELVELNFDRLQLVPLDARHFGDIEQVRYPSVPLPEGQTPDGYIVETRQ